MTGLSKTSEVTYCTCYLASVVAGCPGMCILLPGVQDIDGADMQRAAAVLR